VLPAFLPEISSASQQRLEKIGCRVMTSTSVSSVEPWGFLYGDRALAEADLMVWAAGVKAPDFMNQLAGLATNRANQIVVSGTLQALHDENIFVVGACASLTLEGAQRPIPPGAQVAKQQAKHLARHLPEWLCHNKPVPRFEFRDFGSLTDFLVDVEPHSHAPRSTFHRNDGLPPVDAADSLDGADPAHCGRVRFSPETIPG
jgi:NADH dehydrogenase